MISDHNGDEQIADIFLMKPLLLQLPENAQNDSGKEQ
jgi:hypothetical protein